MSSDSRFAELLDAARAAQRNAYAPYSKFHVGAAILLEDGSIFSGCNVENASYGGTICAERGAILSAVAQKGPIKITEIVVVSNGSPPWPPCGMCRQVISEFCGPDVPLHAVNENDERSTWRFEELFPMSFSAENMK
jgi:cytidine deaminase